MVSVRGIVISMVLAAAGIWIGLCGGWFDQPPTLVCERTDFGDVFLSRKHVLNVPIRNSSPTEIRIKGFTTSCTCSEVSPPSLAIPAGARVELQVVVDLTKSQPRDGSAMVWPFRVQVQPLAEAGQVPLPRWSLSAQVRRAVWLDPPRISLEGPAALEVGRPPPVQTFMLHAVRPWKRLSVREKTGTWTCQIREETPTTAALDVSAKPFTRAGQHSWDLEFDGEFPDLGSAHLILGRIDAAIRYPVRASPDFISFGAIEVGQKATRRIVVSSPRHIPFSVVSVPTTDDEFSIQPRLAGEQAETEQAFDVILQPKSPGPRSARLTFQIDSREFPERFDLEVGVTAHGVPRAGPAVTPASSAHP